MNKRSYSLFGMKLLLFVLCYQCYYSEAFSFSHLHGRSSSNFTLMAFRKKHHHIVKEQVNFGERVVGVDYGKRRVGMAASLGFAPRKLGTITNKGSQFVVEEILKYAESELSTNIVMGLPLDHDGTESTQSLITRKFAQLLLSKASPGMSIFFVDERFTSKFARARMREVHNMKSDHIDDESACAILEAFFQEGGERAYSAVTP